MVQDKKMKYEAPTIDVVEIELEQGIAGGSAGTPHVNDWEDNGSGSQDKDF